MVPVTQMGQEHRFSVRAVYLHFAFTVAAIEREHVKDCGTNWYNLQMLLVKLLILQGF
jgi:hypothetical protein